MRTEMESHYQHCESKKFSPLSYLRTQMVLDPNSKGMLKYIQVIRFLKILSSDERERAFRTRSGTPKGDFEYSADLEKYDFYDPNITSTDLEWDETEDPLASLFFVYAALESSLWSDFKNDIQQVLLKLKVEFTGEILVQFAAAEGALLVNCFREFQEEFRKFREPSIQVHNTVCSELRDQNATFETRTRFKVSPNETVLPLWVYTGYVASPKDERRHVVIYVALYLFFAFNKHCLGKDLADLDVLCQ